MDSALASLIKLNTLTAQFCLQEHATRYRFNWSQYVLTLISNQFRELTSLIYQVKLETEMEILGDNEMM